MKNFFSQISRLFGVWVINCCNCQSEGRQLQKATTVHAGGFMYGSGNGSECASELVSG